MHGLANPKSIKRLSETFLIVRRIQRDIIKNVYFDLILGTRYACQIFKKFGFID
jgi:hypothetical protein